jgi:tetratricopeptide (TPR) repeat protein
MNATQSARSISPRATGRGRESAFECGHRGWWGLTCAEGAVMRSAILMLFSSVLLGAIASPVSADTFADITKAILDARKALEENRVDETQNLLMQALGMLKTFEPTEHNHIREAILWINDKKPDAALKALDKALQKNKKSAEAHYLRAHVYGKVLPGSVFNNQTALKELKLAFELKKDYTDPVDKRWDVQATYDLWNLLTNDIRDVELAAGEFQLLVDREPENAKFLYFLGMAHSRRNSFEEATDVLGKGLALQPGDWQMHIDFAFVVKKAVGVKGAILRYDDLLKQHPTEAAVQMGLAKLLVEAGQKERARTLLLKIRQHKTLLDLKNINDMNVISMRLTLAEAFAGAEEYQEAAGQYSRVLAGLPATWSFQERVRLKWEFGKALVKAGNVEEGIRQLIKSLEDNRTLVQRTSAVEQQRLNILIELGNAHRLAKRHSKAEMYFREYIDLVKETVVFTVKVTEDVKTAENLGDLYLEDGEYAKAAEVYAQALELINDLAPADREKYPRHRVLFHRAEAFHGQAVKTGAGAVWANCIAVAHEVVNDKEYAGKARLMLARAYFETRQPDKALDYLAEIGDDGDPATMKLRAQALLASNRPDKDKALAQIEKAIEKQPDNAELTVLHARVLALKDQTARASELYAKILNDERARPFHFQASMGMGDLKMQLAKESAGTLRVNYLAEAKKHYENARERKTDDAVALNSLSQAMHELALAEADLRIQADRWRIVLYTGGLILAAAIPIGFGVYFYRRQWAMRCFQEVCALERDLIQLIRARVQSRFGGRWERLAEEPFRGRIDFKSLRNRADKEGARDILAVANFGHLVGIIDAGWDILGFSELCAPEMVDPKEVILANLSYIGSCRVCLAHVGKLEEMTGRRLTSTTGGDIKAHLSQHLHRQVKTSLQIIRAKFRIATESRTLPVLAPVAPGTA